MVFFRFLVFTLMLIGLELNGQEEPPAKQGIINYGFIMGAPALYAQTENNTHGFYLNGSPLLEGNSALSFFMSKEVIKNLGYGLGLGYRRYLIPNAILNVV